MSILLFSLYTAAYYTLHSFLTSHWIKTYTDFRWYRIIYNLIAIITIIPIVISLYRNSYFQGFGSLQMIVGFSSVAFGLLIHRSTFKWFTPQEFAGTSLNKEEDKRLISDGIYETLRHPFYLGTLFIIWGLWVIFGSMYYLSFAMLSTVYVFIGSKLEEAKLIKQFGTSYQNYIEEVPMLLPFKKPLIFINNLFSI